MAQDLGLLLKDHTMEFSEREIKIVQSMLVLMNPQLSQVPPDMKKQIITTTLNLRGIQFDEREIIDIGNACVEEQKAVTQKAMSILQKHPELLKQMSHFKF